MVTGEWKQWILCFVDISFSYLLKLCYYQIWKTEGKFYWVLQSIKISRYCGLGRIFSVFVSTLFLIKSQAYKYFERGSHVILLQQTQQTCLGAISGLTSWLLCKLLWMTIHFLQFGDRQMQLSSIFIILISVIFITGWVKISLSWGTSFHAELRWSVAS